MSRPRSLYKYVTTERIDILQEGLIRFTSPNFFNDPFEFSPIVTLLDDDVFMNDLKVPKHLRHDSSVLSVFNNTLYKTLCDTFVVLSLTETFDNLLMWSHYTDSHKGFILEFDTEHDFFDDKKVVFFDRVDYSSARFNFTLSTDIELKNFLAKGDVWGYEKEWRVVSKKEYAKEIKNKDSSEVIYLFDIPFSALKSVIFGLNASSTFIDKTKKLILEKQLNHISIFKMEMHDTDYALVKKTCT